MYTVGTTSGGRAGVLTGTGRRPRGLSLMSPGERFAVAHPQVVNLALHLCEASACATELFVHLPVVRFVGCHQAPCVLEVRANIAVPGLRQDGAIYYLPPS